MPLSYSTLPGDIDHLIADDHAVVERQFQFLAAGRGDRRVLVDQVAFELVGFQKSACAADLGDRCAWSLGMIVRRVVASALSDLPQVAEPAVIARSLIGVQGC